MLRNLFAKSAFALIALLVIATAAACSFGDEPTPTPAGEGTLFAVVWIGPLCPVEPCRNPADPFEGLEIVLRTSNGDVVRRLPLTDGGTVSSPVPVGEYEASVEPCIHLGCDFSGSQAVVITAGETTVVEFDIDTGIR